MPTAFLLASLALSFPQSVKPDAQAQAAYDAVQKKLSAANSAKATLEVRCFGRQDNYEFRFLRPNFAKITSPETYIYQDGKRFFDYDALGKAYFEKPAPTLGLPSGTAFSLGGLVGLESIGFTNDPKWTPVAVARKSYSNIPAQAITLRGSSDPNLKATLWVDASSGLPIGWDYALQDFKASGRIRGLTFDVPLKPSDFAWRPPAGAKRIG